MSNDADLSVQLISDLAKAHIAARCLHVVAEHGVADALDDATAAPTELAYRTGLDADALERMLHLLAAYGVFERAAQGYRHTPASRLLCTDHPQSLRSYVRLHGMPAMWNGFHELQHAARTGQPARDWDSLLAYFAEHPDESSLFNEAMARKALTVVPAVIGAYDFGVFDVVVDVGGGRGHLLQAILDRAPAASGILFELPHVIADAADVASPRLELAAGDLFVDPLPSGSAYVLMDLIHDWSDADAARILAAIRRAARTQARLLIIETLRPEEPGPHFGKTLDVIMLAVTGGRERTRAQYAALLEGAQFHLERVVETTSPYSIVDAVAV
jgi:hypothetical protein